MQKNVLIKIVFILFFCIVYFSLFNFNMEKRDLEIESELNKFTTKLQNSFDDTINESYIEAESTSSILHGEDLLIDTMTQVVDSNATIQDTLRDKLYKHFEPLYQILQTEGISNFQFVFSNNISFLRMHKPEKYGDDLTDLRYSFKTINETKQEISGLENCEVNLGYRFLFPLFNEDDLYLGAYEISYSIDYIQSLMESIDNIKTDFLLNTHIFKKAGWENKELLIQNEILKAKAFSVYNETVSSVKVLSFLPLKNIENSKTLAYLIASSDSPYIEEIIQRYKNKNIITLLITILIVALLYWLAIHQQKIKEEKERFQLAIDSSNDGIWDWNIAKDTTYFSPKWKEIIGFEDIEIGDSFDELQSRVHKDDKNKFTDSINQLLDGGETIFECEYRVKHKNGDWIWILGRAKAKLDKNNKPLRVVGFHSDITLKKEYENQQEQLIQDLKDVATSKSDFLATMSHEIRTPMNAILGFIQILINKEEDTEKLQKFNIINDSGKSLLRIINDILDFSKIDSKKLLIENIPFNIKETVEHTQELFQVKAKDDSIELELYIDEEIPTTIMGDQVRIDQILSNLISNAIKFSKQNSTVKLNLLYLKESNAIRFEVIDNGVGIAQNKLHDIFNPFTQEDTSTTRKYGGTGLGLSISKALCELMNGEIGVESTVDVGSTFYFTLPIIEFEHEIENNKEEELQTNQITGDVLIVEDNKTNQLLLAMLLDEYEIEYTIANDGVEAVDKVKKQKFDLILMDENMPNMNGIEATKIIKGDNNTKDIPIVAVTANAIDGDKERFIKAGMDDYISKPIDINKLDEILNNYLNKGRK